MSSSDDKNIDASRGSMCADRFEGTAQDAFLHHSEPKLGLSESIDENCSFTSDESCSTDNELNQGVDVVRSATIPFRRSISASSRHCWTQPEAKSFSVRGRDYLTDRKKVASGPCLFSTRGCELFLSEDSEKTTNVARNTAVLGGDLRKVPTLLINLRFPWGVLVTSFKIEAKFLPFLRCRYGIGSEDELPSTDDMSPAEERLCRFFTSSDAERNASLKMIPKILEGPWIVRGMVSGTPVIIGNKVPIKYSYQPPDVANGLAEYLEVELDVGPALKPRARKIVSLCRRYMESLSLDIGFVIEGENAKELPEQMLAAATIHKFNPQHAPNLEGKSG